MTSSPGALRIAVAGAAAPARSALARALADALADATGLTCRRLPSPDAPEAAAFDPDTDAAVDADTDAADAAIVVVELASPHAPDADSVPALTLLLASAPAVAGAPSDDARQDAAWRGALIERGACWAALPPQADRALQAALDAAAPWVRALSAPRDGLFTRLARRNAAPAARPWRCERCDDARCEHRAAQAAPEVAAARGPGRGAGDGGDGRRD